MSNNAKIILTGSDLRHIKDLAGQVHLSSSCPKDVDSSEFIAYCYTKAVEMALAKHGVNFTVELETKLPYEPV